MIAVSCRLRDARGDLLVPYYRTVSRGPACRAVYIICRVISRVIAVKAACPFVIRAVVACVAKDKKVSFLWRAVRVRAPRRM